MGDVLRKSARLTRVPNQPFTSDWRRAERKCGTAAKKRRGKVVLLNEACSLKYDRRHSFGIYFSSSFGSVTQLAGKMYHHRKTVRNPTCHPQDSAGVLQLSLGQASSSLAPVVLDAGM